MHAEGITEALLFHVDLLASAIRQAVIIKDHKSFLKVHPNTFRGQAAIEWLRGHAARALFGSEAEKEKNQQLSRSVALLLGQKLLAVGVFRQVTGSLTKPLEDPNALFRFHEDEKEGPLLNCRSIWFQNAREPLLVVSELLYTMLNLRLSLTQRGQVSDVCVVRVEGNRGKAADGLHALLGDFCASKAVGRWSLWE